LFGFGFAVDRDQPELLITIPVPTVRIDRGLGMQSFHRNNERDAFNGFTHLPAARFLAMNLSPK